GFDWFESMADHSGGPATDLHRFPYCPRSRIARRGTCRDKVIALSRWPDAVQQIRLLALCGLAEDNHTTNGWDSSSASLRPRHKEMTPMRHFLIPMLFVTAL